MPVTDRFSIRYPGPYDTVDALSWQNMATDIDAAMTIVDAKRALAAKPDSAQVYGNSTQTMALATPTVLIHATERWDNGNLANLGVNNDRLTLNPGIWLVVGGTGYVGMTNVAHVEVALNLNGAQIAQTRIGGLTAGAQPVIQVSTLVIATAITDYVQVTGGWTGSGGPATVYNAYLQATKMRVYP